MRALRRFTGGMMALVRRRRVEAELDAELEAFLAEAVEHKVSAGMTRAEAERAARLELGSPSAVKEWVGDAGWETRIDTVWQDVRYALRTLFRAPRFAIVAILTFALGIGTNLAIFTLADGMLFRPLPYRDPDRLVLLQGYDARRGQAYTRVDRIDFEQLAAHHSGLEGIATVAQDQALTRRDAEGPATYSAAQGTPNVLELLGVGAHIGRPLRRGDETGDPRPAMLTFGAWERRFGADPSVIGRILRFDQRAIEIVGVLPQKFLQPIQGSLASGEIFFVNPLDPAEATSPKAGVWSPVARLKSGVSLEAAQAEVDLLVARAAREFPQTSQNRALRVAPLQYALFELNRSLLWLLVAAAGGVLLIVSVNLATLLLGRGSSREREIGIRSAIGASRGRIVRQLLVESLVLGVCAAAVALLLASVTFEGLARYVPPRYRLVETNIGLRSVSVTLLIAMTSSVLFGLLPAFRLTAIDAAKALRHSRRGSGSGSRLLRMGAPLVAAEVTLCVVLLAATGLTTNSLVRQRTQDLGFVPADVATVDLGLPLSRYSPAAAYDFHQQVLAELRRVPGLSVAGVDSPQIGGGAPMTRVRQGAAAGSGIWSVTDGYFATMGIAFVEGEDFSEAHVRTGAAVAIIGQSLAQKLWPEGRAVGRILEVERMPPLQVIGVVRDVRNGYGGRVHQAIYRPIRRDDFRRMPLQVKTAQESAGLRAITQTIVQRLDPAVLVGNPRLVADTLDVGIADSRFQTGLFALFGIVGLGVAAIGIYGVMAHWVTARTYEFGVRLALGAHPRRLMTLVIRQACVPLGVGLALGLAAAFALTRRLESLLYEITAQDPLTFALVVAILAAVGLLAAYVPARRAARVDPLVALRTE